MATPDHQHEKNWRIEIANKLVYDRYKAIREQVSLYPAKDLRSPRRGGVGMIDLGDDLSIIGRHMLGLSQILAALSRADEFLESAAAYLLSDVALDLAKAIESRVKDD